MQSTAIPVRPGFWNVPLWAEIGVYIVGLAALIICIAGIVRSIKSRRLGAADEKVAPLTQWRTKQMLKEIFLQPRVMQGASGKAHFAIFWGFLLLFWGTATATLDWDIGHYVFGKQFLTGNFYLMYKLILDTAGLAALIALCFSLWRRFVRQDPKVEQSQRFAYVLGSLVAIILTGFLVEALRLATQQPAWSIYSPVGHVISLAFVGLSEDTLRTLHIYVWVIHGLAALTFVAAIPLTYYAHIFKTPSSIFWKKETPMGAIAKIEDIEEQESFGISDFKQFSWRDRIRFDGCTECGRCRGVCPAVKAKTPLDPKNLILSLKHRMHTPSSEQELIDGIVEKDALWSCTTCGACTNVCPAQIPIHELIVSMRRHLALEQGDFPEGLAGALENTASVGNPWGMDPGSRLAWAKGLDVPVAKPGQHVDVLYWVGCSASYDRRAQKIAKAMVNIFKSAGVSFAVMQEERCHADFARRAGEEYLFQTAAMENIENLAQYSFGEIVAACPHCFSTLKNEYPQFEGGAYEVTSHADFIDRLLRENRLPLTQEQIGSIVFHDPCYLARYNGIEQTPRAILNKSGARLIEASNTGANATCCGAGGAQIFMDRPGRINVIRLKELKQTKSECIAVACPHCLTMLSSAQAQQNNDADTTRIEDIAEIVSARLQATKQDTQA
ncbi:MAG: (Fe-S)-binding protein [Duodenibacillus sp.]|nr:(Fe-S)-binding protein [Duodenibacillus sp.]